MLPWYVSSVEMSLWAVSRPPHTVRKWGTDESIFTILPKSLHSSPRDWPVTGWTVLARKSESAKLGDRGRA
jgi:hypothetical protein